MQVRSQFRPQFRLLVAAVAATIPFQSPHAQDVSARLGPVIVTATRTVQNADEALAAVTVFTRAEIERLQASSVQELLRGVAGIGIASNGGAGKVASLFLRGTDSDHVLVLVDGVKIGSATAGAAAIQDLPIEMIERIEIVRGPRSGLYGSEAIGGVIQIFTRRGGRGDGGYAPRLALGAGSQGTHEVSAGVSGGSSAAWFDASAGSFETDGFNACIGRPFPAGAGCYVDEPDRDGYRNRSASLRGGLRFDNGTELQANALRAEGRNHFDGSFENRADVVQEVYGAQLRAPAAANTTLTAAVGRSADRSDGYLGSVFTSRFDTTRDTASVQGDIAFGAASLLTLGVDYQNDRVDGSTQYTVGERANTGVFVEAQTALGAHALQASVRSDDNQQFGSHVTGNLGWGTALGAGVRAYASAGTGFKAPSFNDLYYPGFGNPALEPEESKSVELGLKGTHDGARPAGRWSASVFYTRIDRLIGFDASFVPANIDQARITGFEANFGTTLAGVEIGGTLTLLDPKNRSAGADDGKQLPRRAKQMARIDLDRGFGAWRVGASLNAEGRRYDDQANAVRLGGFATLDLRAEYAFARDWRLQAKVSNATDKVYQTAYLFAQPGRSVFVTLRYQPAAR